MDDKEKEDFEHTLDKTEESRENTSSKRRPLRKDLLYVPPSGKQGGPNDYHAWEYVHMQRLYAEGI